MAKYTNIFACFSPQKILFVLSVIRGRAVMLPARGTIYGQASNLSEDRAFRAACVVQRVGPS